MLKEKYNERLGFNFEEFNEEFARKYFEKYDEECTYFSHSFELYKDSLSWEFDKEKNGGDIFNIDVELEGDEEQYPYTRFLKDLEEAYNEIAKKVYDNEFSDEATIKNALRELGMCEADIKNYMEKGTVEFYPNMSIEEYCEMEETEIYECDAAQVRDGVILYYR